MSTVRLGTVEGMKPRAGLLLAVIVVAASSCSSDGSMDSASTTSEVAAEPQSTEPILLDGTTPTVSEGTLALPPGAPAEVAIATYRDSDNNRCIEVRQPPGSASGACWFDDFDELSYVTAPADDQGAVYVVGVTELAEATQVMAVLPNGGRVEIPIVVVDGWPERAFAALFEQPPTRLEVANASGEIVAWATN